MSNALIGAAIRAMGDDTLAEIAKTLGGTQRQALLIHLGALALGQHAEATTVDETSAPRKGSIGRIVPSDGTPRRGRPAKADKAEAKGKIQYSPKSTTAKAGDTSTGRPRGEKRTADELVADTDRVYEYIMANPICGSEQIQKNTGMSKEDITLPIKKLLATGKITAKGQKRAMRYAVPSAWAAAAPTVDDDSDDAPESTPAPVRGSNRVNGVARRVATGGDYAQAGADAE